MLERSRKIEGHSAFDSDSRYFNGYTDNTVPDVLYGAGGHPQYNPMIVDDRIELMDDVIKELGDYWYSEDPKLEDEITRATKRGEVLYIKDIYWELDNPDVVTVKFGLADFDGSNDRVVETREIDINFEDFLGHDVEGSLVRFISSRIKSLLDSVLHGGLYHENKTMRVKKVEGRSNGNRKRYERRGNRIVIVESNRKDELFGGLIGKVNATEKDGEKLAKFLSSKPLLQEDSAEVTPTKYGFGVLILTEYKGKPYSIQIDEDGSNKIVVTLSQGSKKLGSTSGLRLDNAKIYKAILDLLKKEGINAYVLKKPKSNTRSLVSTWDSSQKKQADSLEKKWKEFERKWDSYLHDLKGEKSLAKYNKVKGERTFFWNKYREDGMSPEDCGKKFFFSSSSQRSSYGGTFDDYYASVH
jgi:hypothetical protein